MINYGRKPTSNTKSRSEVSIWDVLVDIPVFPNIVLLIFTFAWADWKNNICLFVAYVDYWHITTGLEIIYKWLSVTPRGGKMYTASCLIKCSEWSQTQYRKPVKDVFSMFLLYRFIFNLYISHTAILDQSHWTEMRLHYWYRMFLNQDLQSKIASLQYKYHVKPI